MLRARRTRRAAVTDLYKNCKLGGDCPPDVINKVEGTTLADRLLQIFGSILFLGNLGIGTGKGSGGFGGYRPIGGTVTRTPEVTVPRPSIPIDPLGGADVIPLDVINPEAPSIIPLSEGALPQVPITDDANIIDVAEIDLTSTQDVIHTTPVTNQHPTIISETNEIITVDIQPGPPPPKRIALDVSYSSVSDIQLNVFPQEPSLDSNINVFVDPQITGEIVGLEDIELQPITDIAEFEIEERPNPKTSTPLDRVISGGRRLYNRFVEQVQTRNPTFITQPSRLIQFEIDNPAFDKEVSLEFEQDVNELRAAPDANFQDIVYLSRPHIAERNENIIVSRFGQRGTMTTRSGLKFGQRVHFFYELSSIPQAEDIELRPYGIFSGEDVQVDALSEASVVNSTLSSEISYPDELLLDPLEERFENAQLVLHIPDTDESIPTLPPGLGLRIVVGDAARDILVDIPIIPNTDTIIKPVKPFSPLLPSANVIVMEEDYLYDPDIYRKRRKRKLSMF